MGAVTDFVYGRRRIPAWVWPSVLLVMGLGALVLSVVFYPGGDEWTYLFGMRFGAGCSFTEATGLACPSCGMTRSWVHLSRGQVITAATYNIAGATLLLWLWVGGFLGAVRLITRDYKKWQLPYNVVAGFGLFWMIVLYIGFWLARIAGLNPLPVQM